MRIDIVTGFPDILDLPLQQSIIRKGREKGAVDVFLHNLRDYTDDKHKTIDDYPYGGGPGMVLKIEPFDRCLRHIDAQSRLDEARIVMPSPRGQTYSQEMATKLSLVDHLVFLCGHYKGIDERIKEFYDVQEISIGDYIISSGEIGALVIIDSLVRLMPGVIRDIDSAWTDSFSEHLLDAPYYTRPDEYKGSKVPDVLLTGNHEKINAWREQEKIEVTKNNRPDLYKKYLKSIK